MATFINGSALLDICRGKAGDKIEVEFFGRTIEIKDPVFLKQIDHDRLNLVRTKLSDYYAKVIQEQEAIKSKLDDQSISGLERQDLEREMETIGVKILGMLDSSGQNLLALNAEFIEILGQLEDGEVFATLNLEMESGSDDPAVKEFAKTLWVTQYALLIRNAIEDQAKNFTTAINQKVLKKPAAISQTVPIDDRNGSKLKTASIAA